MKVINLGMVFFCLFLTHNSWAAQQSTPVESKGPKRDASGSKQGTGQRMAVVRPAWVGTHAKDQSQLREALLRKFVAKQLTVVHSTVDCTVEAWEDGKKVEKVEKKVLKTSRLHAAIDTKNEKAISAIIAEEPALIDSVDDLGRRPVVMLVVDHGDEAWALSVLVQMFKKCPYLVNAGIKVGDDSMTLVQWAYVYKYDDLYEILLSLKAKWDGV
jgi:hypothetical protein